MCISPLNKDSEESPSYTPFNKLTNSYTNLVYISYKNFTSRILAADIKRKISQHNLVKTILYSHNHQIRKKQVVWSTGTKWVRHKNTRQTRTT